MFLGLECGGAGQRQRQARDLRPCPEPDDGGADGWADAAGVEPGRHGMGGGEERVHAFAGVGEGPLGRLHRALRVEVRCGQPLVEAEGVARGFEDLAALSNREREVHAQPQSLDHRREMPGVDEAAVDSRLSAHRIQPHTVEKGTLQRVACESLIKARDGSGCMRDVGGESPRGRGGSIQAFDHARRTPATTIG